jgi:hypothetical protein
MPTADGERERMREAIAEAVRTLARAEVLVHKYYESTAEERGHEATPVQDHLYAAHQSLKKALEELEHDQTP